MTLARLEGLLRDCDCELSFTSEVDPGPNHLGRYVTAFGKDCDWNPAEHSLKAGATLSNLAALQRLYGPAGLVPATARVALALEWSSSHSDIRGLGEACLLSVTDCTERPLELNYRFPANSIRGVVQLSLELFLVEAGEPAHDEQHLAAEPGTRLGTLGFERTLVFDGDAPVFPVVSEPGKPECALWELRQRWDDPCQDEFEEHFVALVLNEGHPDFSELGLRDNPPLQTALFRQVLSSWLCLLILELKRTDEQAFQSIRADDYAECAPGSIARAIGYMMRIGELDTSSEVALNRSVQVWLDRAMTGPGGTP
jgi:hypothetical protein